MTISIIIPTKNRIFELKRFIDSLNQQTITPAELVVADASQNNIQKELRKYLNADISLVYLHFPKSPGTNFQRNKAIKIVKYDIVFLFDDDIVLEPDYLAKTLAIYKKYPDCAGVVGRITNIYPPKGELAKIKLSIMDFIYYFWQLSYFSRDGRIRMSGLPTYPFKAKKVVRTTIMCGGCMSVKNNLLKKYLFDEKLTKYCYMEDVDLSYRLSREHELYYSPFARCQHLHSIRNRQDDFSNGKMLIINHNYLFKKNLPQNPVYRLAHVWSIYFLLLTNLYNGHLSRVKGMLAGLKQKDML